MPTKKKVTKERMFLVRATAIGFYGNQRRRVGTMFAVPEKHFTETWMEFVKEAEAPVKPAKLAPNKPATAPQTMKDIQKASAPGTPFGSGTAVTSDEGTDLA